MSATILNTDTNINAKTVMVVENAETVTGLKTFDRDPNPPFAVTAGSAQVANLGISGAAVDATTLSASSTVTFTNTFAVTGASVLQGGVTISSLPLTLSVGQCVFPAVQNPSAGVNTLDDYEEGTWTPAFASSGGGAATYGAPTGGTYVKVGQFVQVSGIISLSAFNTLAAGTITITGLPFTSNTDTNNYATGDIGYWQALTVGQVAIGWEVPPNSTAVNLYASPAAAVNRAVLLKSDISATTQIRFSFVYRASA